MDTKAAVNNVDEIIYLNNLQSFRDNLKRSNLSQENVASIEYNAKSKYLTIRYMEYDKKRDESRYATITFKFTEGFTLSFTDELLKLLTDKINSEESRVTEKLNNLA